MLPCVVVSWLVLLLDKLAAVTDSELCLVEPVVIVKGVLLIGVVLDSSNIVFRLVLPLVISVVNVEGVVLRGAIVVLWVVPPVVMSVVFKNGVVLICVPG